MRTCEVSPLRDCDGKSTRPNHRRRPARIVHSRRVGSRFVHSLKVGRNDFDRRPQCRGMRAWIRAAAKMWVALGAALLLLVAWLPAARADAVLPSPGGWPVGNPPQVLRPFDPPAERWGRGHRGVDLAAEVGAQVLAAAAGRVSYAARLAGRGVVVVDHGAVRTTYEPVRAGVPVGTTVAAGTVIGRAGAEQPLRWPVVPALGSARRGDLSRSAVPGDACRRRPATSGGGPRPGRAPGRRTARGGPAGRGRAVGWARTRPSTAGSVGTACSRPVSGPITSPYGRRLHPILHVWKLHDGTDFGASCGTPIRAAAAGRVTNRSFNSGYGNRLMIDHGTLSGRRVITGYNHASRYVVRARRDRAPRSGDRLRGQHRLLHRLPPAPDDVAERSADRPDALVVTVRPGDAPARTRSEAVRC